MIKGIEAEVPKLKKTMKKMSEEAVKAAGEVDAAKGGYSDAASAIMESITSGLDKRQELLVSKLDNKIDGYVDKVVKKYEKLAEDKKTEAGNTTDATQKKKLQEEAKKLRKNAKKIKNYANKYTSTFMDALKEGTEKAYSKIEDDLDKKLDGIADKYQKAYDKIISFRDDMKKKMSEPANMYDLDTSRAVPGRSEKAQGQDTGKPDGPDPWHGPERGRQLRGAPERNVSGRTGGVQGEMGTAAEFVRNLQQGIFRTASDRHKSRMDERSGRGSQNRTGSSRRSRKEDRQEPDQESEWRKRNAEKIHAGHCKGYDRSV